MTCVVLHGFAGLLNCLPALTDSVEDNSCISFQLAEDRPCH